MSEITKLSAIVDRTLAMRTSVRAFSDIPVSQETVEEILRIASRAPSGTNTQPWRVYVLTGETKRELTETLVTIFNDEERLKSFPKRVIDWTAPYQSRRKAVGKSLYEKLEIRKADIAAMKEQHAKNYDFFGAPIGLIFTIDKFLDEFSFLDYGMFLQNIMLAATVRGLDTCTLGSFMQFDTVIVEKLGLSTSERVICGMALGYRDLNAPENDIKTEREALEKFVRFVR